MALISCRYPYLLLDSSRRQGVGARDYFHYELILGRTDQFLDAEIHVTDRLSDPECDSLSLFDSEQIDVHW